MDKILPWWTTRFQIWRDVVVWAISGSFLIYYTLMSKKEKEILINWWIVLLWSEIKSRESAGPVSRLARLHGKISGFPGSRHRDIGISSILGCHVIANAWHPSQPVSRDTCNRANQLQFGEYVGNFSILTYDADCTHAMLKSLLSWILFALNLQIHSTSSLRHGYVMLQFLRYEILVRRNLNADIPTKGSRFVQACIAICYRCSSLRNYEGLHC